jgi:hypothetical protein
MIKTLDGEPVRFYELPADHKAMLRRRLENDAEIKALKADLKTLDKSVRQFKSASAQSGRRIVNAK